MIILGMIALSQFVLKVLSLPIHLIGLGQIIIRVVGQQLRKDGNGRPMFHVYGRNGVERLMGLIAIKLRD